jgi:F-type H+-transporting ATPase subunit b
MAEPASQTGTVAPGGPKAPFPPFNPDTFGSQVFWLVIAFVALYLVLAHRVLPGVARIFAARRAHIEGDLAAARRLTQESEAAIAAYEKELAAARARAQTIARTTREEFTASAEKKKAELEASLAKTLAESEAQIRRTRDAAMANVREVAVDAATAIVEALLGKAPARPTVERAVDSSLH